MSERERWIVYPLLFLALGAALRDKLIKQTVADKVICKKLIVIDDRGDPVTLLTEGKLVLEEINAQQVNATNLINQARAQAADSNNWVMLSRLLRSAGLPIADPRPRPPSPPQDEAKPPAPPDAGAEKP